MNVTSLDSSKFKIQFMKGGNVFQYASFFSFFFLLYRKPFFPVSIIHAYEFKIEIHFHVTGFCFCFFILFSECF